MSVAQCGMTRVLGPLSTELFIVRAPQTFWERMTNAWAYVEEQMHDYLTRRPRVLEMQCVSSESGG